VAITISLYNARQTQLCLRSHRHQLEEVEFRSIALASSASRRTPPARLPPQQHFDTRRAAVASYVIGSDGRHGRNRLRPTTQSWAGGRSCDRRAVLITRMLYRLSVVQQCTATAAATLAASSSPALSCASLPRLAARIETRRSRPLSRPNERKQFAIDRLQWSA
jgi:hypothetical protein